MAAYFHKYMEIFQKVCKNILVAGQSDLSDSARRAHNVIEQKTSAAEQLRRVIAHLERGLNITLNYKLQTNKKTTLVGIGILVNALMRITDGTIDFCLSETKAKILKGKQHRYPCNALSEMLQIRKEDAGDSAFEVEISSEELDVKTPTLTTPIRGQVDRSRKSWSHLGSNVH